MGANTSMLVKYRSESQTSIKHENEYLVSVEEETISTSPSPLELHEVGPSKKEEDEEVHFQEPNFLKGP